MTEGRSALGPGATAPSPTDLLFDIEDLASALRRLAAVGRLHAAEHGRLLKDGRADKRDALDGWRAAIDLLDGVITETRSAYQAIAARVPEIAQALDAHTPPSWAED